MTARLDRITQQRRQKLDRIRDRGINPYPHSYHRSHTTQQAIALLEQQEASSQTETPPESKDSFSSFASV